VFAQKFNHSTVHHKMWPLDEEFVSWRILFGVDAAVLIGAAVPVLLYPSVLLRKWYLPGKAPELMSDVAKQLVLLLWVCAGLVAVLGLMALAVAVSPVDRENGWIYLAFAVYHGAGFTVCFFHVLNAELYGFDKRLNSFWRAHHPPSTLCPFGFAVFRSCSDGVGCGGAGESERERARVARVALGFLPHREEKNTRQALRAAANRRIEGGAGGGTIA